MIKHSASATLLLVCAALTFGLSASSWAQAPSGPAKASAASDTVEDGFTFAAAGDTLGPHHPVLQFGDPGLGKVAAILRGADVAFANLEGSMFDPKTFNGFPQPEPAGGYPLYDAAVGADLKNLGIKMVSRANNHAFDFGVEGLMAAAGILDAAGIVHSGSGPTGPLARAPAYLNTAKGKIALISATATYVPMAVPGDIGTPAEGRPGVNVLRTQTINLVTAPEMAALRRIAARQAFEGIPVYDPRQISLGAGGGNARMDEGQVFRLSDKPGQIYEVSEKDRTALLASINNARKASAFVAFSLHAHQHNPDGSPAEFIKRFFHEAIDAGADIVIRHGPHALGGIEIYKGKPIFYDMGSLFLGADAKPGVHFTGANLSDTPSGAIQFDLPKTWYDTAVAVSEFRGGKVSEIRVYPLTMNLTPGPMHGTPRPASAADALRILKRLQRESLRYGTVIRIEQGVGVIRGPTYAAH
jgi:poly-gamma-glutamate synthesis protein (capsule biosynthesis protein)